MPSTFNRILLTAAVTGLFAGASIATANTASAADATADTSANPNHDSKHACKGLNSCKGQGGGSAEEKGKNACKGQGACATVKHDCKGMNSCKGQGGGSADDKGKNACKGKGGCKVG